MSKNTSESGRMDWCIESECHEFHGYCPLREKIIRNTRWVRGGGKDKYNKLRKAVLTEEGREDVRKECENVIFHI